MKSPPATLILRIPAALHRQLKGEARAADVSLNRHCRALLSRRTARSSTGESPLSLTLASGRSRRTALLRDLAAHVLETWGDDVDGIALFGSCARGRPTADSDIDLLVVLSGNVALDRDIYSRWQLRRFAGREVAPLFVQIPREGERVGGLWFEVALEAVVLFDRDLRLSHFLSYVRNLVADGRVRRMVTHGHPYWVHSDEAAPSLSGGEGS